MTPGNQLLKLHDGNTMLMPVLGVFHFSLSEGQMAISAPLIGMHEATPPPDIFYQSFLKSRQEA